MFHLLMGGDWNDAADTISRGRVFEHTDDELIERFAPGGEFDQVAIASIPAVFSAEFHREPSPVRVGTIHQVRVRNRDLHLRYTIDHDIPRFTNEDLVAMAGELDITDWEFSRNHWAIKDVDLFRALIGYQFPNRLAPQVFDMNPAARINQQLVSVMMPFSPEFDAVFDALRAVADDMNLECLRADNIWNNPAVIQDVFELIYTARVVICDCTGRNANVFYETGIAHTIGRDVILITQANEDIPFDLNHLRYVRYLNNEQGLDDLSNRLRRKFEELM